jgi:predicted amino acid racemase
VSAPRLEVDLHKIEANTRHLSDQLTPRGISITGVTKAVLGSPEVGAAMLRGGAAGLGDSRVENLDRLRLADPVAPRRLIRSPMLSQVDHVVRVATSSLNTSPKILESLDSAARRARRTHDVVIMVELGDLREGVAADEVPALAARARTLRRLQLCGLGANLACQNGVVPDDRNMRELSRIVEDVERRLGTELALVSGGNSANLPWALSTSDPGRITELRVGEAILLGTEPLHRTVLPGLHDDAFRLVAEVIEIGVKPARPWGERAQNAHGDPHDPSVPARTGTTHQALLALGRQDVDPDGLVAPPGMAVLGMSSDHTVLDVGDHQLDVGAEITFGLGYGALVRAMTSPFVAR